MKKVLLIIAFVLILIAIPVTLLVVKQRQEIRQKAAPATTLELEPSTQTVQVGDTFSLDVVLDTHDQNEAAAAEINLTYSPLYFEGVSFQRGSFMPATLAEGIAGNGTASIIVGMVDGNPTVGGGVSGRGTIAVLTLKALQPTGGETTIVNIASTSQVAGTKDQDEVGTNILVSWTPAEVTISGGAEASPSPSPSPSPGGPTPTPSPGTASPSPSATPTGQVTYITQPANGATVTTARPLILGTSFPNGDMLLSINTSPITTATFTADADGDWSYQVTSDLANGTYTVTVTGDSGTAEETATSSFTVSVGTGGTTVASPSPSATPGASDTGTEEEVPVTGNELPTLIMLGAAFILIFVGSKALLLP